MAFDCTAAVPGVGKARPCVPPISTQSIRWCRLHPGWQFDSTRAGRAQNRFLQVALMRRAVLLLLVCHCLLSGRYSYGHGGIVLRLEEFYCDLYMRRHYRQLLGHLGHTVDAVVFLGDLFDGGRTLEPDSVEYNDHTARFRSIFRLPDPLFPSAGTDGVPASTPEYVFLTGNHDVGQGR